MLGRKLHGGTSKTKVKSRWTGTSCFFLEVPLRGFHPSMCDFLPCDRIVQSAYLHVQECGKALRTGMFAMQVRLIGMNQARV